MCDWAGGEKENPEIVRQAGQQVVQRQRCLQQSRHPSVHEPISDLRWARE